MDFEEKQQGIIINDDSSSLSIVSKINLETIFIK